ncbi:MAG: FAD-binding oxidoreductase [Elusimicrobia bacterium]|nr:FAD-binding oxidoreductase [Elusimicrobiota bacterium]
MKAPKELARLLGASKASVKPADLARAARDFAGNDLGRALCVVRPADTEDVRKTVLWARKAKTALTPMGALSSFWAATRAAGRVALDLRGLSRLLSVDALEGVAHAQAGMSVAAFDAALSKKGLTLAAAPDGFGDATLGSLAANDTVAGLGQFAAPATSQLVGLTVVLGTGEILRTGASSVLGLPAFALQGVPDPTGLFLASEGSLGIVTELLLRASPRPKRSALVLRRPSSSKDFARLAAAARALRGTPGIDRFLVESWVTMRPDEARVELAGPDDEALRAAARRVAAAFKAEGLPEPEPAGSGKSRWQERPLGKESWKGVSLQVPHANAGRVYDLWVTRLRGRVAGVASPEGFLRTYLNAYGCASLFGWSFPAGEAAAASSAEVERGLRTLLGPLGIPYRAGTVWRAALDGRLDPVYAGTLRSVKTLFDPDGILNPGVGVVDAALRRGTK